MKLDSKRKGKVFTGVIIGLFILVLITAIVSANPEKFGAFGATLTDNYALHIIAAILVLIIIWAPNSFSYDDTDEVVIIKTKRLVFGDLIGKKSINYEIPRRKIRRVRVSSRWFKKYLHITINGKKEVHRIQKLDATLLSSEALKRMQNNLEDIATNQNSSRRNK